LSKKAFHFRKKEGFSPKKGRFAPFIVNVFRKLGQQVPKTKKLFWEKIQCFAKKRLFFSI